MTGNKFLFYLLCGVMFSPAAALGECKPTQDCRALGYKEAPCPEQGVKCPFGETWYCPLRCKDGQVWKDGKCTDILGSCSGAAKNCKIGQILNSDASCSDNKVSGKTPIGVVVYISPEGCGWAMTASPIQRPSQWSSVDEETGTAMADVNDEASAIKDFNACQNTQKLIQLGDMNKYPAAWAAVNYAPSGAPATKGKWCLPAPGMLKSLHANLDDINSTILSLGGTNLKGGVIYIWSSSEARFGANYSKAWCFTINNHKNGITTYGKGFSNGLGALSPVIEF